MAPISALGGTMTWRTVALTDWIAAGDYVVRMRIHFTTSYVNGAVIFGHSRRDRDLRLSFSAGGTLSDAGDLTLQATDGVTPNSSLSTNTTTNVGLKHAEGLLVTSQSHVQGLQQSLRGEVIHDDSLIDWNSNFALSVGVRIQTQIENQLFWGAGNAAEVRIASANV